MIQTPPPSGWARARELLRKRFSELRDDDLVLVVGREEDLLETIIAKTGRTRDEVLDTFNAVGLFTPSPLRVPAHGGADP